MPLPIALRRALYIGTPLLLLAAIVYWMTRPEPVAVRLITVDEGPVEETVANTRAGTVKACRRSKLSLQTGGRVAELRVKEGDQVKKGDLLLRLESEDRSAQVEQARAQLIAAREREKQACRAAAFDQRDLERTQKLVADHLVSLQSLDMSRTKAAGSSDACSGARAEMKVAVATQRLTETMLAQTELRAPFDGIVAEVNGEIGEFATPSPPGVATPPAVDLIDNTCLYVTAPVDEVDAARLKTGTPARITLDAYRGRTFAGKVTRLAPYVLDLEKQARTVAVDVQFDTVPDDIHLLAGHSADIEIILAQKTMKRLPTEAVQESNRVLLYHPKNKTISTREFTRGISNWSWTGIDKGLEKGDRVVLSLDRKGVVDGAQVVEEKP